MFVIVLDSLFIGQFVFVVLLGLFSIFKTVLWVWYRLSLILEVKFTYSDVWYYTVLDGSYLMDNLCLLYLLLAIDA